MQVQAARMSLGKVPSGIALLGWFTVYPRSAQERHVNMQERHVKIR